MFDYLSIVFIGFMALFALIGLIRGGFKMLAPILVFAAAITAAIFLAKPVAGLLAGWGMQNAIQGPLTSFLNGQIHVEAGIYTVTGSTELTSTKVELINTTMHGEDPQFDLFHASYACIGLPNFFFNVMDGVLNAKVEALGTGTFTMAQLLGEVLVNWLCLAVAFLIVLCLVSIIGSIITAIIGSEQRKKLKRRREAGEVVNTKIGPLSRLLGMLTGVVLGAALVWACALVINSLLLSDNMVSAHLKDVLRMNDPNAMTFAKWVVTSNFGYNEVLAFFVR